ncbi:MAG: twin-arginine translocase subunit TatC [Planctomycetes bacterium]|nr:twin-arginine translocase subunit TatC [Planctomycetota bacterium]
MAETDDTRMTLEEHIVELRACLLRALIGVVIGVVVCLVFGQTIMQVMCWPAAVAMRASGLPVRLLMLAPAEAFSTYVKVCLIWGLIVSSPYGLWQLWRFVAAGLFKHERRHVRRYVPLSMGLFAFGVVFFFVVIAPICLQYFFGFARDKYPLPQWANPIVTMPAGTPAGAESRPCPTTAAGPTVLPVLAWPPTDPIEGQTWIDSADGRICFFHAGKVHSLSAAADSFLSPNLALGFYMTFVSWLSLVFGLGFQVPIVVLVLARTQLVPYARLRACRKYVILVILIVAAILTPPDVVSQLALALPMYLLFELGLLLAGRARRGEGGPGR